MQANTIDPKLERFFKEFEKAIAEHDFAKLGGLYGDSIVIAGPRGSAIRTKADFLVQARNASTFYESVGQTSLKILSICQTQITGCYSLVKVCWGATFRATRDRVVEFDDSYLVQTHGAPKIIVLIAHQDERAVLKKLGIDT